ncbi:hypothetical protein PGT21_010526 [Puccinia graminis f. sp. tritici]|uniref:Uncharacterized protein n=2 Tax=Puccinia graminis f. sp. tritici TaxID=56615 RepID=E3K9M1_PUCGT|nr:uncharacterized protein PGTG_07369 [Puccinia graminis f. sp. tritici CRL 75-36-700-3]EFP81117.2 hypothetical protein PGTG_07369 [Puccinia graminis f. sp. tritici CRL 75-36-700-3]KAA1069059.1 hypothetical protein PGT21_010526 [Puccinia graminis f. sp. tritici]
MDAAGPTALTRSRSAFLKIGKDDPSDGGKGGCPDEMSRPGPMADCDHRPRSPPPAHLAPDPRSTRERSVYKFGRQGSRSVGRKEAPENRAWLDNHQLAESQLKARLNKSSCFAHRPDVSLPDGVREKTMISSS